MTHDSFGSGGTSGRRGSLIAAVVVASCVIGGAMPARTLSVVDLLDRYAAGQFPDVERALSDDLDYADLLNQLRRDGPGWIAAVADDRARRELVAATFALEAARAGEWHEWRLLQKQPRMCPPGSSDTDDCYQPLNVLYWQAPPLLIEWGCALFRREATPGGAERWWQLAALAVAQRSEDPQFLIGDPNIGLGADAGEIGNTQDEIKHLDHVTPRFPNEMRFVLAQGIARDADMPADAARVYRALETNPDVGGEAMMRLGAQHLRERRLDDAIESFERADYLTRDPYVVFLARYFKAQALERQGQTQRAEAAYRGAAAAVPHAQSATVALAGLVFRGGRRAEAHLLVADMLAADPPPLDPWRAFAHADDRFWPQLVGRLRAEILK
jgi:tetratricopeptide (TPR) repeat protein